jgi:4-amino-4-deoxy-L-arabinose transferase-like glycosyltransferase
MTRAVKDDPRSAFLNALPLIAICLLPVLLYLPSMASPFERDEGVYATVAQGLLKGQMPYRDLFDNKPPLVYGWYALSFLLFGEHVVAPRMLAAMLLSLTTLSLFSQARMIFPRGVAYVASGLFGLSTGLPFVALHANTEAYMLLPLVTSLVAFTIGVRRGGMRWFVLSGALCGVAMMTKQVAFWNLAALVMVAPALRWKAGGFSLQTFRPSACLVAGAAVAIGLVAVPFAITGSLDELFYANVSYNWLYVGVLSYSERLADFASGTAYVSAVAAPLVGAQSGGSSR